jgi:hypothetical protein
MTTETAKTTKWNISEPFHVNSTFTTRPTPPQSGWATDPAELAADGFIQGLVSCVAGERKTIFIRFLHFTTARKFYVMPTRNT